MKGGFHASTHRTTALHFHAGGLTSRSLVEAPDDACVERLPELSGWASQRVHDQPLDLGRKVHWRMACPGDEAALAIGGSLL